MQSSNSAYIAANSHVIDLFSSIECRYKFLEFQVILSKSTITHLSFSREIHQKALKQIVQLLPTAKWSNSSNELDYVKIVIKQILDSGQDKPDPDFKHNPFLQNGTPFQQKVWRLISQIQPGKTATYGELAAMAGSPGGARAVGRACNQNPLALIIPCHRVVAANGLGGFAGDLTTKRQLLEIEKNSREAQSVRLSDIICSTVNF